MTPLVYRLAASAALFLVMLLILKVTFGLPLGFLVILLSLGWIVARLATKHEP